MLFQVPDVSGLPGTCWFRTSGNDSIGICCLAFVAICFTASRSVQDAGTEHETVFSRMVSRKSVVPPVVVVFLELKRLQRIEEARAPSISVFPVQIRMWLLSGCCLVEFYRGNARHDVA